MSFNPQVFRNVPCSSFLTECFQLRSSPLYSSFKCSTSQDSLVSLVCQRSNLVLPLIFLFRFPFGAILDLGLRSSRSGGVLQRPETDVPGVFQLFAVECLVIFASCFMIIIVLHGIVPLVIFAFHHNHHVHCLLHYVVLLYSCRMYQPLCYPSQTQPCTITFFFLLFYFFMQASSSLPH